MSALGLVGQAFQPAGCRYTAIAGWKACPTELFTKTRIATEWGLNHNNCA